MALRPVLALAFAAAAALAQPATLPRDPGLPDGVDAFASVRVARLWDHPASAPLRNARGRVEFAWFVQASVGLPPAELDRVTLFWPADAAAPVVVVTGRRAVDPRVVAAAIGSSAGEEFRAGRPLSARSVLLVPAATTAGEVERFAAAASRVEAAAGDHVVSVGAGRPALTCLPDEFAAFRDGRTAAATLNLAADTATIRVRFEPSNAVPPTRRLLSPGPGQHGGTVHPSPLLRLLTTLEATAERRVEGPAVVATTRVGVDELMNRLQDAAPDAALAARGSAAAAERLQRIATAVHNYHDDHGHTPGNVYAADGTPLLSWRVRLLPYLGEAALFRRFNLGEPWDGPANREAARTAVRVFQTPGRPAARPWDTHFQAFSSPPAARPRAWLTDGAANGPTLSAVTNADGLSSTIMVVEAGASVPWAQPADLPFVADRPLPKLGGPDGTFAVVFGDGRPRILCGLNAADADLRAAIGVDDERTYFLRPGRCGLPALFRR